MEPFESKSEDGLKQKSDKKLNKTSIGSTMHGGYTRSWNQRKVVIIVCDRQAIVLAVLVAVMPDLKIIESVRDVSISEDVAQVSEAKRWRQLTEFK